MSNAINQYSFPGLIFLVRRQFVSCKLMLYVCCLILFDWISSLLLIKVDLDKLRLPDGVSISKISGPVPERRYFPCKETDAAAPRVPGPPMAQNPAPMGPPWANNPYSGAPPPSYSGPTGV